MGHPKRYVDFTSTGIHVDIERYLDTPEGKEALDRIDQAGKAINSRRKKVPKPYVIRYRCKDDGRIIGWAKLWGTDWRTWGRYAKLSDAEHVLDKMLRSGPFSWEFQLTGPLEASQETP